MKKILIGCPTSEHKAYCLERYAEGIKNLNYKNFDVLIVDNSKGNDYFNKIKSLGLNVVKDNCLEKARDRIVSSRNLIRNYLLNHGYDYLLSLEQDVIPPPEVIETLLEHKKDIVSGVYFNYKEENGNKILIPVLWEESEDKTKLIPFKEEKVLKPDFISVKACGLGCVLISREVLEKVTFRYEEPNFDDLSFCSDAIKEGFEIFADTSIKCLHLIVGFSWEDIKK